MFWAGRVHNLFTIYLLTNDKKYDIINTQKKERGK